MFVRSLRAAAIGGFAASIFLASGTFENGGRAEAATLDNVTVDRSVRLLDGTVNVFPGSPAGFAVSTFGATMIDLAAPAGYSVSGSFDGTGGVIDFFDTGFPPSSIFAGAIQDVNYESGFLAILFEDTASSDLLVLEASNTGLPGLVFSSRLSPMSPRWFMPPRKMRHRCLCRHPACYFLQQSDWQVSPVPGVVASEFRADATISIVIRPLQ